MVILINMPVQSPKLLLPTYFHFDDVKHKMNLYGKNLL